MHVFDDTLKGPDIEHVQDSMMKKHLLLSGLQYS